MYSSIAAFFFPLDDLSYLTHTFDRLAPNSNFVVCGGFKKCIVFLSSQYKNSFSKQRDWCTTSLFLKSRWGGLQRGRDNPNAGQRRN